MAFGLKRWIGVAVLGCAVLAVWGLPPRPFASPGRWRNGTAAREAAVALQRKVDRLNQEYQRRTRLEEVGEVLKASGEEELVVWTASGFRPEVASEIRREVRARVVDAHLRDQGKARIGVFVMDRSRGGYPGVRQRYYWGSRVEYHVLEKQNTCAVFVPLRRPESLTLGNWLSHYSDLKTLGPCLFYREYGMPGRNVQQWMRDGALVFAWDVSPGRSTWDPEDRRWIRFGVRGLFQADAGFGYWGLSTGVQACVQGSVDHCRTVFLDPVGSSDRSLEEIIRGRQSTFTNDQSRGPFHGQGQSLLADLQAEFGKERFQAFWTSDAPVDQAFEASFGIPVGDWTVRWAHEHMGSPRHGTRPGPATAGLSLLFTVLLGGAGLWVANKRTLG